MRLYPNAPLFEAVFEIRFPGEPAVECHRDKLFEQVRELFPQVLVPEVSKYPSLQPYHFKSADGNRALIVAINRFAVSTKRYEGFEAFQAEVMTYMSLFGTLFHIQKLNRTGLRYINVIPYARESGLVPLARYLNLKIDIPPANPPVASSISLGYAMPILGGSLTIRVESVTSEDNREAFVLDFDYAKQEDLTFERLQEYLVESHTHTKNFFEGVITIARQAATKQKQRVGRRSCHRPPIVA